MAGIYGNSQCTIAALASEHDDGGCFRERPAFFGRLVTARRNHGDLQISLPRAKYFEHEYEASGPGAAPLHQRAWIIQERALSPRTLYYGSTGLLWECREADASDFDPMGLPYTLKKSHSVGKRIMEKILRPINTSESELAFHSEWATLVLQYTNCALTKPEDRQYAIRGFTDPIQDRFGFTQVACLWKQFLHTELLWSTPLWTYSKRVPQLPTWSWISTSGSARPYYHPWKVHPLEFHKVKDWTWKAEIIKIPDNCEIIDYESCPILTIRSSLLKVYGFSDALGSKFSSKPPRFTTNGSVRSLELLGGQYGMPLWGDWLPDLCPPEDGQSLWLLPIVENSLHSAGLVIVPNTGDGLSRNEWIRVGSFIHYGNNGWFSNISTLEQSSVNII
jgi:hypothetical protein